MNNKLYRTAPKYQYGGLQQDNIPNAELEKGEPIMTPDGQMAQVPNNAPSHAQGGVPVNIPQGTAILGKMIDPYTDKQYKQLGEKLVKQNDKYSKMLENKPTGLLKRTAEKMIAKNQKEYQELMQRQEQQKIQENPNPEQFAMGGYVPQYGKGGTVFGATSLATGDPLLAGAGYGLSQVRKDTSDGGSGYHHKGTVLGGMNYDILKNMEGVPLVGGVTKGIREKMYGHEKTQTEFLMELAQSEMGKPNPYQSFNYDDKASNWKDTSFTGLNANEFQNPYEKETLDTLKNLKYDSSSEMEANRNASAMNYANLRRMGGSAGRMRAGLQANQMTESRMNNQTLSNANNVNNQYKTNYAQTLGQMGQYRSDMSADISKFNAGNSLQNNQFNAQGRQSDYGNQLAAYNANMNTAQANEAARMAPYSLMAKAYGIEDGTYTANNANSKNSAMGIAGIISTMFSDKRLKKDIKKVDKVNDINIYEYKYKKEYNPDQSKHRGVIAQEVEKKIPGSVSIDPRSGFKMVNYDKVINYINKN